MNQVRSTAKYDTDNSFVREDGVRIFHGGTTTVDSQTVAQAKQSLVQAEDHATHAVSGAVTAAENLKVAEQQEVADQLEQDEARQAFADSAKRTLQIAEAAREAVAATVDAVTATDTGYDDSDEDEDD